MPTNGRQPRLPDIEENAAVPFSSLFADSFDRATVEATAQLADSSIFITSSGSRFRLQRMTEASEDGSGSRTWSSGGGSSSISGQQRQDMQAGNGGSSGEQRASSTWGDGRSIPPAPAQAPPAHWQAHPPQRPSISGQQPQSQAQTIYSQQAQLGATPSHSPARSIEVYPNTPSQIPSRAVMAASEAVRSSTNPPAASAHGRGTPGVGRAPSVAVPPVDEAIRRMSGLSIEGRFGAAAMFTHSDGGVHVAETLTDSQSAGRLGLDDTRRNADSNRSPGYAIGGAIVSDTRVIREPMEAHAFSPHSLYPPQVQDPSDQQSPYHHQVYSYHRDSYPTANHYGSFQGLQAQNIASQSNPGAVNPDSFLPPAYAHSHDLSPHRFSSESYSTYPEKPSIVSRSQSLPSLMEYSSPVVSPPPTLLSTRLSPRAATSFLGENQAPMPLPPDEYNGIDTQTPIVVRVHTPPSSQTPDSSSATRDNVLPGEDVMYDGFVKSAHTTSGPFEEGHLKVFRNNLSNDIRFHCKTGNNTETHWMKGANAKLVPIYAYDQRSCHLVYIRDTETDRRKGSLPTPVSNGPSAVYQFACLHDLFKFQSNLTGEFVVLDISSVKWIRLARANSRTSELYSSVRLQIWHEPRSRKTMQSDVASFVTAGTALSGPLRERTVPNSSRLMVFLGRSEEYITSFITDDIEMEPKGHMSVSLKPRKYSGIQKRNSKPGIRARLEKKSAFDPASLDIHGEPYSPDVEQSFDLYKTFEIEFESSPSQVNFVQAWKEVLDERRKQRARLAKIQDEMRKETFSSKEALSIKT